MRLMFDNGEAQRLEHVLANLEAIADNRSAPEADDVRDRVRHQLKELRKLQKAATVPTHNPSAARFKERLR